MSLAMIELIRMRSYSAGRVRAAAQPTVAVPAGNRLFPRVRDALTRPLESGQRAGNALRPAAAIPR